jgi:glycosyltransferase involved in cell wall biosynthesis
MDGSAAAGVELRIIGLPEMLDAPQELVDKQRPFLDRALAPRLGAGVKFLGEVGEERLAVLGGAVASGTPIVTFDRGSAREITEQGISVLYVGKEDDLVDALDRARELDPRACRAHVERVLSMDRVGCACMGIYRALDGGGVDPR